MNPIEDDDEVVRDGQKVRVSLTLMDSLQKAIAGNVTVPALCRPGYVQLNDAQVADKAATYAAYNERLNNAWKAPPPLLPQPHTDTKARAAAADHYGQYDKKVSERWRGPKAA